jgi:ABC-type uncharacterized transport system permease subunit
MHSLLYILAIVFYLTVATHFWQRKEATTWTRILLPAALLLHGFLLYESLFSAGGLNLGLTNAVSAIFWLTALIYVVTNLSHQLQNLQAFILPIAALCVLVQWVFPEQHVLAYSSDPLFKVHLTIAFAAYSLLTFAALHALLMAAAERTLHRKPSMLNIPSFPPLMAMEKLLFQIITIGFVLLTLTLLSGMAFDEQLHNRAFVFNHKTVFTIISWFIFGALLYGHRKHGWRGKVAIRWTLSGFVVLFLAYVGSKFVLEFILHR